MHNEYFMILEQDPFQPSCLPLILFLITELTVLFPITFMSQVQPPVKLMKELLWLS